MADPPSDKGFPYDSTLPLLAAFVGALTFLGLIGALLSGGTADPGAGRAAAATTQTATEPIATTTPATPTVAVVHVTLTLGVLGDGKGTIGIGGESRDCSDECSLRVDQGSSVRLDARPTSGSTFVGWTGACGNTRKCSLTMDKSRSATALFTLATPSTPPSSSTGDCHDGIDDDGDGYIDDADPDCVDGNTEEPANTTPPPVVPPAATTLPPATVPPPPVVTPPPAPVVTTPPAVETTPSPSAP